MALESISKLTDIVSAANPVTWAEYLKARADVTYHENSVVWYSESNCHYLVKGDDVYYVIGFQAYALFNSLADSAIGYETIHESAQLCSRREAIWQLWYELHDREYRVKALADDSITDAKVKAKIKEQHIAFCSNLDALRLVLYELGF